jgi:hypothetical protein
VLVYFGYPQAHEDHAERAVGAGLELVAAIGALKTHAPLQTRVGIATRLVVVGDLIGWGASQETSGNSLLDVVSSAWAKSPVSSSPDDAALCCCQALTEPILN